VQSFEEWSRNRGLEIIFDEYGKPIIEEFVFDLYMSEVAGAEARTDSSGNKVYFDSDGTKIDSAAWGKASAAAASAGLSSLWSSYLQGGKIDEKDFIVAAGRGAVAGGQEWWSSSGGGSGWQDAGVSGLSAGAGTAIESLAREGEVDWEKALWSGGKAGVKNYVMAGLGQQQGGPAAGIFWGLAIQGLEDKLRAHDSSMKNMLGIFGSGLAGPIGGFAGQMLGSELDAPENWHSAVYADESKPPVWIDKDGAIHKNPIIGVVDTYSSIPEVSGIVYKGFNDREEYMAALAGQKEGQEKIVRAWEEAISNYANLSIEDQMQIDLFRETGDMTGGRGFGATGFAGWETQGVGSLPYIGAGNVHNAKAEDKDQYLYMGDAGRIERNQDQSSAAFDWDSNAYRAKQLEKAAQYYSDTGGELTPEQKKLSEDYQRVEQLDFDEHGYVYTADKDKRYTREELLRKTLIPEKEPELPSGLQDALKKIGFKKLSPLEEIESQQGGGIINKPSAVAPKAAKELDFFEKWAQSYKLNPEKYNADSF
jgi:hypothetical protein